LKFENRTQRFCEVEKYDHSLTPTTEYG